jgi:GxxExxY protein
VERQKEEPDLEVDELTRAVIGAAIEVDRHLGPGYLEGVYEEALAFELALRGIPLECQKPVAVDYMGHPVGEGRLDFLVAGSLVVELKAVDALAAVHKAQVISYLKTTSRHLGLLVNFNSVMLKNGIQRVILSF